MDIVEEEVEKAKKEWDETFAKLVNQIKAIENYGKSTSIEQDEIRTHDSLPRMNGVAQDCLALLNSLQFKLDLLAPQLPTDDQVQSAKTLLESWTNRSQRYNFLTRLSSSRKTQAREQTKGVYSRMQRSSS